MRADLSVEMQERARGKGVYDDLVQVDLNDEEEMMRSLDGREFGTVVSAWLFLPGHCGPPAFGGLVGLVEVGGHVVCTVREAMYKEMKAAFRDAAGKYVGVVISDELPYFGKAKANVSVVQRRA